MTIEEKSQAIRDYFKSKGFFVVSLDARTKNSMKSITAIVMEACKEKIERDRKRGIKNRPVRAMVVGIPNVGKSTFINSYAKKACTKVGNKPGVTKGKQWVKLSNNIEVLDVYETCIKPIINDIFYVEKNLKHREDLIIYLEL